MNYLRKLYFSPLGWAISAAMHAVRPFRRHGMTYGIFQAANPIFKRGVRISVSALLENRRNISISDYVWIGPFCVIDGSNRVSIGEGAHLAAGTFVFTHGSQDSIRLHGRDYIQIHHSQRIGYTRGAVSIGAYTFIGAGSIVLPGVALGIGCLVAAGSVVIHSAPDFSILMGNPARIVGDTRATDRKFIEQYPEISEHYFNKKLLKDISDFN